MSDGAQVRKKGNTFFQILVRDLKLGGQKNISKYILTFCFTCVVCAIVYKKGLSYMKNDISAVPQVKDYIIYFFGGISPFDEGSKNNIFRIPYIWMSIQLLIGSCVCLYPIKDLYNQGVTTLVQYGSRIRWWVSKCIWSLCQVIIVYAIIFTGIAISLSVLGVTEFTYNREIIQSLCGYTLRQSGGIIANAVIMSVVYSIMVTMVQINMSLIISPVYSFALVVAYDILSSYLLNPALLGNMAMLCRLDVYSTPGVNGTISIAAAIITAIASVVIGLLYFKRHDILDDKNK